MQEVLISFPEIKGGRHGSGSFETHTPQEKHQTLKPRTVPKALWNKAEEISYLVVIEQSVSCHTIF